MAYLIFSVKHERHPMSLILVMHSSMVEGGIFVVYNREYTVKSGEEWWITRYNCGAKIDSPY